MLELILILIYLFILLILIGTDQYDKEDKTTGFVRLTIFMLILYICIHFISKYW